MLYSSREDGGIAVPNTTIQNKSLKVSWIQCLLNQPETKLAKLALRFLPPGGTAIFKGNIWSKDIICSKLCNNGFWKDVLLAWADLSYKEYINEVEDDKQKIWYNSNVRVQNKIVFFNAWYNAGIITIGDLKDPEGKIKSYDQFSVQCQM